MITTLQSVTPDGKKLIAVEAELKDIGFFITTIQRDNDLVCPNRFGSCKYTATLPDGKWSILGSCTHDNIDFDPAPIVKSLPHLFSQVSRVWFDYKNNTDRNSIYYVSQAYSKTNANESFRSLLSASSLEFNNNNKYVILKEF